MEATRIEREIEISLDRINSDLLHVSPTLVGELMEAKAALLTALIKLKKELQ